MRFNFGCGRRKLAGFVNVDGWAGCEPDEVWDLEATPWPWPDNCASEAVFNHSLEHMGQDPKVFLAMMSELYRVCADGAVVRINVPHPRHDNFLLDPTHVRPIGADTLRLFDRQLNDEWLAKGAANSALAHQLGVDFRIFETAMVLDEPYAGQHQRGELDEAEIHRLIQTANNVARELRFVLHVRKSGDLAKGHDKAAVSAGLRTA